LHTNFICIIQKVSLKGGSAAITFREEGLVVGSRDLAIPITYWPYPTAPLARFSENDASAFG
jgi:hypothetical protein